MRFPTAPYDLHVANRSSCSIDRSAKRRPGNCSHVGKAAGAGQASIVIGTHAGLPIRKIHRLGSTESTNPRSARQDSTDNRTCVKRIVENYFPEGPMRGDQL